MRVGVAGQFLTYMAVGLTGTAAHYLCLIGAVQLLAVPPVAASALGFVVGAVVNYFANYYITFRSRKRHLPTLFSFVAIAGGGLVVNTAIMALFTLGFGAHYLLAQVVASGTVVVLTYLANRRWTFRQG